LYFGGNSFDVNPDLIMTGVNPSYYLGIKVSPGGDLNGDGFSDILVGGYKVYAYFGGTYMDNIADVTLDALNSLGLTSNTVETAGDVNGDGFSDIIVGGNVGGASGSRAYIFKGGLNNVSGFVTFYGGETTSTFGLRVCSAGDVNGDGYSDVIVSDYIKGKIFLYYGGSNMNNIADVTFNSSAIPISSAGDVNGDGYSDILIGSYLYFGGTNMNNIADFIFSGGNSSSSAGDVNADGYMDVITSNSNTKKVYIYYGSSNMDNIADLTLSSEFINDGFGNLVSTAGDFNDDGYDDVIIGAENYDTQRGRLYLYPNLLPKPELKNPLNKSTNNPVDVNFKWKKINESLFYSLNISTDSLFNDIIINDTLINDTTKYISGLQRDKKYYWRVFAKDNLNNIYKSLEWSFFTVPEVQINPKLLFQGMYSPIFNQLKRRDSINTYIRNSIPPFALLDSAKTIIDSILFTGNLKFYYTPTGNYYFTIKHFNSLETWCKSGGLNIINDGTVYNYDFTSSITQSFGSNMILNGNKYCIFSGDIDQDGYINLSDVIPINNDASSFVTGSYLVSDLTGDNIVDLTDLSICYNNASNFVRVIRP